MYSRIVVPVDSSAQSKSSLTYAIKLAKGSGSKPIAIYINPIIPLYLNCVMGPGRQYMPLENSAEETLNNVIDSMGIPSDSIIKRSATGDPAALIIKMAAEESADLIVINSKLLTLLGGFSSVSCTIIKRAPCPVLVVK